MFTLLPSLYFLGVQYYQQWKGSSPSDTPTPPSTPTPVLFQKRQSVPKIPHIQSQKVRKRRKKQQQQQHHYNHLRRKTSISELSHDDLVFLMNETGFTRDKILVWYTDFLRDCPDGKLSKTKFIEIYQKFYKKGQVTKFCEHAFRLFNKDGSGYMDFIEFLLAVSLTSSKDPIRKIELFFSMYDSDQNGLIDENEMKSVVESVYELLGIDISDPSRIDSKVHDIFSKAECDQLGYLRKDQFAIACENDRHIRKLLISTTKSSDNQEN